MAEKFQMILLFFPVFLFSLSFHESAHAWTANRLGDSTARLMGRMTLNPLAHIDWIGTIIFPLMMFLMPGLLLFGWAKPVPVNPNRLRGGRQGRIWVAAAGPAANILLALIFAGLMHLVVRFGTDGVLMILLKMLETGVILNLMLAMFNLVPIPPLDGSGILEGVLPVQYLEAYERFSRFGFLILLACLYLGVFRYLTIPIYAIADWLVP